MCEDILNEQEAINSIYGEHTLEKAEDRASHEYFLAIPRHQTTLRLVFPPCYPDEPPHILGTVTIGEHPHKGHGNNIVAQARDVLQKNFLPGAVCIFDLLQELDNTTDGKSPPVNSDRPSPDSASINYSEKDIHSNVDSQAHHISSGTPPEWTLSSTVTLKKSVFVARACEVASPSEAKSSLANLLANDKRVVKATHNITAYRIRQPTKSIADGAPREVTYQDCDDDGETAAGGRLLHLLQVLDVWNVFVVVSRWYGGVQLGPDRFRLISQVAREAVVEGGWSKDGKSNGRESQESHPRA